VPTNVSNPQGFRPTNRSASGGPSAAFRCHKLAAYPTALFIGDAVTKVAAGSQPTPAISAAITPGTTPTYGVNLVYGAANTLTLEHLVIAAGNLQMFEVQDNNDVDGVGPADINKNGNIELFPGNALTQMSGHWLDESTISGTATLDLKLQGLLQIPGNVFGSFARVLVTFNNSQLANQVAGL